MNKIMGIVRQLSLSRWLVSSTVLALMSTRLTVMESRLALMCMVCQAQGESQALKDFLHQEFSSKAHGSGIVGWCLERAFQRYVEIHKWLLGSNVNDSQT